MDWPLGLGCLEFVNFQRRPWHLALLALQVCVLGTATGSGQEGRLQFGSWSTQTLGENPKCWWSLMVVDGRCDRWGSLWSWWFFGVFPKILGNYCSTCRNIPTHLMPESEIDFPKFVAWSFGSSKHSKHHVPHTKMGFGSGIWTLAPRDLCFAQDIEPEPVSPYTVPDFKTKKTSFLCGVDRACHVVTSQRLATNHAHISWIHPIARWGILWRPTLRVHILICKHLCISAHISQNFRQTSLTTDIPKPWAHHHAGINLQWPAGRFPDTATEHRLGKAGAALHLAKGLERSALEKFERIQTSKENLFHSSSISFWNKNAASNKLQSV